MADEAPIAFGIDAFALDDRMRLFHFLAADKRLAYLWVLRAFNRARANYQVLLHTPDVATQLAELAAEHSDCPLPDDLPATLDALVEWGNLDRGQDAARAATVQEYRNRHSVYQLTDAGFRAYQAVEQVLAARLDDATLSRLVFPDILDDLRALAAASAAGDAEEVYRKLNRLDGALTDMAERAARFYLLLGELARTTDHRAEVFLAHKDALLTHMREFHSELLRYSPRLHEATLALPRPACSGWWSWPRRPTTGCSARRWSGWRTGGNAGPGWWPGSGPTSHRPSRTGCSRPRWPRSVTCWPCCAGSRTSAAAE